MNTNILSLTLLLLLVGYAQSISITVSSIKQRCMIVSSNYEEQLLKVDLKFKKFADQALEEGYRIVLHNTETHQEQAYQTSEGTFRKEFQLTENVVYRFCFKIVLSHYREVHSIMEYNANVVHRHIDYGEVKIPEGLVNVKDLQETYKSMVGLQALIKGIGSKAEYYKKEDDSIFNEQNQEIKFLSWVSIIEIIVVVACGGYQFFQLKKLIENKQH